MDFESYYNKQTYLDYLLDTNTENEFDWNEFFEKYNDYVVFESIENPELIQDITNEKGNRHLEYGYAVNGVNFKSIVDAVKCSIEIESLDMDIVSHEIKKANKDLLNELKILYSKNPDKYVLKYQFKDDAGNTYLSNKLGNAAFAVLKIAQKVFLSSVGKVGLGNVFCVEFHVAKIESKRLDLYKKMFDRNNISNIFNGEYQDTVSDSKYITYYRYRK
jgi:hypothetical protein